MAGNPVVYYNFIMGKLYESLIVVFVTLFLSVTLTLNMAEIFMLPNIIVKNHVQLQGGVFKLLIDDTAFKNAYAEFNGKKYPFFKTSNNMLRALVPVHAALEPSQRTIDIYLNKKHDTPYKTVKVQVENANFPTRQIRFSKTTFALREDPQIPVAREVFANALNTRIEEQMWNSYFIWPLPEQGRITSPYGQARIANGGVRSRHYGIDIALPTGTPVYAANNGQIVISGSYPMQGNAVVIAHGHNVFSTYYHLHELKIEPGAFVKKGDLIGTLGTTGYSTGPHLHWGITVNWMAINPETFTKNLL